MPAGVALALREKGALSFDLIDEKALLNLSIGPFVGAVSAVSPAHIGGQQAKRSGRLT
jgi:hypothetical protein